MRNAQRAQLAGKGLPVRRGLFVEALPELAAAGVDAQLPSRLGIDEPEVADVGQLLLPRVTDLHGDDVVARRELEQPRPPVARAAEVGHDDDHCPPPGQTPDPAQSGAERGRAGRLEVRLAPQREQEREQAAVPLPCRRRDGVAVAEGGKSEPVPAADREVADCQGDAFGHVPLPPVGGAEGHRRRGVQEQPRLDGALGDVDADVRLAGTCGDVPVDQAHVVPRRVGPHLRELGPVAGGPRAVVAREQAVDPPAHGQVDLAQQRSRERPGARSARRSGRTECVDVAHATSCRERSSCGIAIVSSTRSRIRSASTPSASAS